MYLKYNKVPRKEITPARLRAFLKLVSRDHYTEKQLESLLQPTDLNKGDNSEFNLVYRFAMNNGLIFMEENKYIGLNMDTEKIFDDYKFKRKMAEILLGDPGNQFYQITSWILKQDRNILSSDRIEDLINNMAKVDIRATDEDLLGWRFWFKYLGYGYNLQEEYIIANPFNRLGDLVEEELEFNDNRISIREFADELISKAPEFKDSIEGNNLSYPLSVALRTLANMEKIELIYARDTSDIWHLYNMEHQVLNNISHIRVRREENGL